MSSSPPRFPDRANRTVVRDTLETAGFSERRLRLELGVPEGVRFNAIDSALLQQRCRAAPEPLASLLELFLRGCEIPLDRAVAAFTPTFLEALHATGLATDDGERIRPCVLLTSVGDLVFASDLVDRHRERQADFVLGAGGTTRLLASLAMWNGVDSVLDLGAGAGVLAALASTAARRIVASDVSGRAVAFARFNAELNGLSSLDCKEGDLFAPVRGERFDLVLCNPPFALSPAHTFLYRDGGSEICRRIVLESPDHLTDGGYLQMLAEWPERLGADWWEEVSSWASELRCDLWVLRLYSQRLPEYAIRWLRQEHGSHVPESEFDAWTRHLRSMDIDAVGGGLIVLRHARHDPPLRRYREAPRIVGEAGESLSRWIAAQDLLAELSDESELLDRRLVPAPDLERWERRKKDGKGWAPASIELVTPEGLRFAARVDPVLAEIVGLLDGSPTPREALRHVAGRMDVPVDPFLSALPSALSRLLRLGLVGPAKV